MTGLSEEPLDVAAIRATVSDPAMGAVLVFEGVARNDLHEGHRVEQLEYQAHPTMAGATLNAIVAEVEQRWSGAKAAIVHRTGVVGIGEPSVVIAVATPHRVECYEASRYAIEQLKQRLEVWKKEVHAHGSQWKANTPAQGQ